MTTSELFYFIWLYIGGIPLYLTKSLQVLRQISDLILELFFFPYSPSSLIPETGRAVTPMAGNVGVKELGDCRPTPVDPVTKSSEGVFGLFFKFGVGLEGRQRIFVY